MTIMTFGTCDRSLILLMFQGFQYPDEKPTEEIHFAGVHFGSGFVASDMKPDLSVINSHHPLAVLNREMAGLANASLLPTQTRRALRPTELRSMAVISRRLDDGFVNHVMCVLESHIADYRFNAQILARELKVSLRQLFRKFGALLNSTPNVFIRKMRLERAAQLLRDSRMTILEITYAVGFCDPKYFRNVFRKHFGILPSVYARQCAGRSV